MQRAVLVLTVLGVAIIYLGVLYQRNVRAVERLVQNRLPAIVQGLIPPRVRAAY